MVCLAAVTPPRPNPTAQGTTNQAGNPEILANIADKVVGQGNNNDGPLYGDWITVSRIKKNNKQKLPQSNQKGAKGTDSNSNKFKILKSTETSQDTTGYNTSNKGKSVQVIDPDPVQKPAKNWIRKRQRKDPMIGDDRPKQGDTPKSQSSVPTPRISASHVSFPHSNGKRATKDEEPIRITTWSDGTSTSLPLIRVTGNQFRFNEGPEPLDPPPIANPSHEFSTPIPHKPPDDVAKDNSDMDMSLEENMVRATNEPQPAV
ncbi:hypothetical protein SESBI_22791 [Sesbania bispinosa]|nr:hypothetical protein SESBI_22791 [Sesbania bispinosa]